MSQEAAKALVKRYFEALNAGDHDAVLALLGEDVVHDRAERRAIGREKFRWALGLGVRNFRETWADLVAMASDDGSRAAAECTVRGTYEANAEGFPPARGQRYSIAAGFFFEIEDGLISRVSEYRDRDGWLEQLSGG